MFLEIGVYLGNAGVVQRGEEANLTRSMSAKGSSPDNAACAGFFGRLKNEFFYYRDWQGVAVEAFMGELNAYLEYYCERRLKRSLGWLMRETEMASMQSRETIPHPMSINAPKGSIWVTRAGITSPATRVEI